MSDTHTRQLRVGAVLEARMSAAFRDGQDTARGRQPRVNPWDGDAASSVERVLAQMWGRGFSAGNPVRLDQ